MLYDNRSFSLLICISGLIIRHYSLNERHYWLYTWLFLPRVFNITYNYGEIRSKAYTMRSLSSSLWLSKFLASFINLTAFILFIFFESHWLHTVLHPDGLGIPQFFFKFPITQHIQQCCVQMCKSICPSPFLKFKTKFSLHLPIKLLQHLTWIDPIKHLTRSNPTHLTQ